MAEKKRRGSVSRFERTDRDSANRSIARTLLTTAELLRREALEAKRRDIVGGTRARGHALSDGTIVPPSQRARGALLDEFPAHHRDDKAARFDREERDAGRVLRAAFWSQLGDPPLCPGGESGRRAAREFVARLTATLERGAWTRNEVTILRQMVKRWTRRADGLDERFNKVGNRRGRLPRPVEQEIQKARQA